MISVRLPLKVVLLGCVLSRTPSLMAQPCLPPKTSGRTSTALRSSLEYISNPATLANPDSTYRIQCIATQWYRDSIGVGLQLQNTRPRAIFEVRAIEDHKSTDTTAAVYDLLLNALGEPMKQKLTCTISLTLNGSIVDCIDTSSKQPKRTFYLRSIDQVVLPLDSSTSISAMPSVECTSLKDSRSIHIQSNSQLQSVKLQHHGAVTYNAPRAILGTSADIGLPLKDVPPGSVLEVRTDHHLVYSRLYFSE